MKEKWRSGRGEGKVVGEERGMVGVGGEGRYPNDEGQEVWSCVSEDEGELRREGGRGEGFS